MLVHLTGDGKRVLDCVIADIGIGREIEFTEQSDLTNIGTQRWKAPEVQGESPKYGYASDVYALGLLLAFLQATQTNTPRDLPALTSKSLEDSRVYYSPQ